MGCRVVLPVGPRKKIARETRNRELGGVGKNLGRGEHACSFACPLSDSSPIAVSSSRKDTHLRLELDKRGNLVGEDGLDTPRHRSTHLVRVVDGPDANLLAGSIGITDEELALRTNEHRKVEREALACVPEVPARERGRETNVVAAELGQILESRADEDRVPQAEDQARSKERLPVVMRAATGVSKAVAPRGLLSLFSSVIGHRSTASTHAMIRAMAGCNGQHGVFVGLVLEVVPTNMSSGLF